MSPFFPSFSHILAFFLAGLPKSFYVARSEYFRICFFSFPAAGSSAFLAKGLFL